MSWPEKPEEFYFGESFRHERLAEIQPVVAANNVLNTPVNCFISRQRRLME
jgi:hypothetical protein